MLKKYPAKKRTSKSYIPKRQKMLRPKAEYLHQVLDTILPCTPEDRRFYAHIVSCYAVQADSHPDGIPVPYETLRRGRANAFRLAPVLDVRAYWPGHCRQYCPIDSVMFEYLAISSRMSAEEIMGTDVIDFGTGRTMNQPPKSSLHDANGNALPELMRQVITKLTDNRAYLMLGDMEQHYQGQFQRLGMAEASGDSGYSFVAKNCRLKNNESCRAALFRFPMQHEGSGMFSYTPAWRPRKTGRLFIAGGCLQTASRDLKQAAYINMPGFRNYDAKSCQVFIAARLIEKAGIDARPLIDYLDKDDPKEFYGAALGLRGEDAKKIVIALCMGAWLPKTITNWRHRDNSILELLGKTAADDRALEDLLRKTQNVLGPMAGCLRKWHEYLLETYIPTRKVRGGSGFRFVLENAVGMHLPLWELRLNHPRYRFVDVARVAAHLLQGLEQACIQEQIARDDRCRVISIEHDGFIVNEGQADMSLWASITAKHDLSGLRLQEKPLA